MAEIEGCLWNGDCDNCLAHDCIATRQQIFRFYAREEAECERRYGRESVKAYYEWLNHRGLHDKYGRRTQE